MTEDDTFRKLTQRPFKEVQRRIINEQFGRIGGVRGWSVSKDGTTQAVILKECGWTREEYNKAEELSNPLLYKYLKMIKAIQV